VRSVLKLWETQRSQRGTAATKPSLEKFVQAANTFTSSSTETVYLVAVVPRWAKSPQIAPVRGEAGKIGPRDGVEPSTTVQRAESTSQGWPFHRNLTCA
jgi:hypothetical protein